jgi:hypothetical protein
MGGFHSGPGFDPILQQCETSQRFCCPKIAAVGLGLALVRQDPFLPAWSDKADPFLFCSAGVIGLGERKTILYE